ncbi:MAG: molybdate ABC transporter substrate-binding protein [Actinobacteria bacterium]|nr:molybdate ABC transporter substrate-binding protein [Actinomycetota bacterium]
MLATLAVAGAALALLGGCSAEGGGPAATGAGASASSDVSGTVTVLAAASLTETFTELAEGFEAAHPGVEVVLSFGASSALATQIVEGGAPADVFASASTSTMDTVVSAAEAEAPVTFASNTLQIAVPPDNPAGVTGLADLADPAVKVALCQPEVPCGKVAAKVLAAAGVAVTPVTLENDVKSTLSKVELGEVDAGLVYVTDVLAAGDAVRGIEIPAEVNASTETTRNGIATKVCATTTPAVVNGRLTPNH